MTASGFARSLSPVLAYEGGKVDDPNDPGGRTNQGVIQRVYDGYRVSVGKPKQDVYQMTDGERDDIYRKQYWDAVRGDALPAGVDFVVFDGAVNSGPGQSIKWLQRALGVNADGVIGMVTMNALASVTNHDALVDRIIDRREAFLRALKTFKIYGKGWLARTAKVRALGKSWAIDETPTPISIVAPRAASPKADVADAQTMPNAAVGDASTSAGVVTAGVGGTLQTLQDQLTPFSTSSAWIGKLVIALVILGALLAIGGLAYRWWASRKRARIADAMNGAHA